MTWSRLVSVTPSTSATSFGTYGSWALTWQRNGCRSCTKRRPMMPRPISPTRLPVSSNRSNVAASSRVRTRPLAGRHRRGTARRRCGSRSASCPSAHSATPYDEPLVVSTTRTPRASAASTSMRAAKRSPSSSPTIRSRGAAPRSRRRSAGCRGRRSARRPRRRAEATSSVAAGSSGTVVQSVRSNGTSHSSQSRSAKARSRSTSGGRSMRSWTEAFEISRTRGRADRESVTPRAAAGPAASRRSGAARSSRSAPASGSP